MADKTAARMTAFKPGASPPPVEMAIRLIFTADCAIHTSFAELTNALQIHQILNKLQENI
jgi:hypothetical protein